MKLLRPSRVRAAGPPKNPRLVSIADVAKRSWMLYRCRCRAGLTRRTREYGGASTQVLESLSFYSGKQSLAHITAEPIPRFKTPSDDPHWSVPLRYERSLT